ncbi:(R)-mandelonitrile lyase 1-like [Cucumis melo]|uniref:(R)-mandelonitrile lyase 1-like n=1 Tax=Cucumis melo TaxID=3656 RepID=A0A1S3BSB5_CUCME|nr:(R)-mandelonitrile lyase 1-like [Cucumis melo]
MSDNPRFGTNIILPFPVLPSSVKVVGILQDNIYIQSIASPFPILVPPIFSFLTQVTSITPTFAIFVGKFSEVHSEGSLRLNSSTNVKRSPIVRFNYYSHPDDLGRCVKGVRKIGDLLKTKTMEKIKTQNLEGNKGFEFLGVPLPENLGNVSAVEEYCKKTESTYWHYHGGCVVGKVVDGNYKVIGIKNLRIVDGSTFSESPGTNPMATLMMLGRYVGLKVLQERLNLN